MRGEAAGSEEVSLEWDLILLFFDLDFGLQIFFRFGFVIWMPWCLWSSGETDKPRRRHERFLLTSHFPDLDTG
jgi:hypothetical protein